MVYAVAVVNLVVVVDLAGMMMAAAATVVRGGMMLVAVGVGRPAVVRRTTGAPAPRAGGGAPLPR